MQKSIHQSHKLSVAPMMDYTDRFYRWLVRQLSQKTLLYTEMVVAETIYYASKENRLPKVLKYNSVEHPIVVQLGGSNTETLSYAAKICEDYGYDEINLNVGCPSPRVQMGRIGVCLMKEPEVVADCMQAIKSSVSIPVSVKHRIGVDEFDSYEQLCNFVGTVAETGIDNFIVHARKAWLKGVSPAKNRTLPPLNYDIVYRLKRDFPALVIELNGGVKNLDEVQEHLRHVDGVMLGRAAYDNPWILADADKRIYGNDANPVENRTAFIKHLIEQDLDDFFGENRKPYAMLRHLMGLFHGCRGTKAWKRLLSEGLQKKESIRVILENALESVESRNNGNGFPEDS
jgi:tRNA-dihydrouridine synthase A